jgi:hypothetical protein
MLGSRLSLDRLAEWIKWQAWVVQSSLWVDGALAIADKLKSNLPGQSDMLCPSVINRFGTLADKQRFDAASRG